MCNRSFAAIALVKILAKPILPLFGIQPTQFEAWGSGGELVISTRAR